MKLTFFEKGVFIMSAVTPINLDQNNHSSTAANDAVNNAEQIRIFFQLCINQLKDRFAPFRNSKIFIEDVVSFEKNGKKTILFFPAASTHKKLLHPGKQFTYNLSGKV